MSCNTEEDQFSETHILTLAMLNRSPRMAVAPLCVVVLGCLTSCATTLQPTYVKGQSIEQLLNGRPRNSNTEFMTAVTLPSRSQAEMDRDASVFRSWCVAQDGRYISGNLSAGTSLRTANDFGSAAWEWSYSFPLRHPGQSSPAFFSVWCLDQDSATIGGLLHAMETSAFYEASALTAFLETYGRAGAERQAGWRASIERQEVEHRRLREASEAPLREAKAKAEEEQRRTEEQRKRQSWARVESFRHAIRIEAETNCGPVLDVKGSLVKVYFPVSNYGNEHWLRKEQLFPPDYGCRFLNGNYVPPLPL